MKTTVRDLYNDPDCRPYLPPLNTRGLCKWDYVFGIGAEGVVSEVIEEPHLECGGYVKTFENLIIFFNEIQDIHRI